jgi:hypothetical protein
MTLVTPPGRQTAARQLFVNDDPATVAAWCRDQVTDGAVYVAPSAAARRELQRTLAVQRGVTVGVTITTPARLLHELESRAGLTAPPTLPPTLERILVEECARDARMPLFDDQTPRGAISEVARLIAALRANGISPDQYREAGGDPRAARACAAFERRRVALGFADEADRVRALIEHGVPAIPVVYQEPSIANATTLALLQALAAVAPSFHAGLSIFDDGDASGPRQAIAERLTAAGLTRQRSQIAPKTPPGMQAIGGAGAYDEVELVARRILALLRSDTTVHPRDVLAVAPTHRYLSLLHDALARLAVPVASPRRLPALDVPLVRALLDAFRLLADPDADTAEAGLELLATPYVGLSLARHDRLVRSLVRLGRGHLRTWREEAITEAPGRFRRLAESVATLAQNLDGEHHPRHYAGVLTSLALDHGFLSSGRRAHLAAGRDEAVRVDQQGWNRVVGAIDEISESLRHAGVTRLRAAEWLALLTDALADAEVRVDARARDGVHLTTAVTGLTTTPHVFALGWREGLVPRRVRDEPLLPDRVKRALNEKGAVFALAGDRVAMERDRRECIVRAARTSLVVSWPATGDEGEPMLPSFYLDDLGIRDTDRHIRGVGDVTWPIPLAASRGERLARATALARHRPAASLGDEAAAVRQTLAELTTDERRSYDGARHAAQEVRLGDATRRRLAILAGEMSASQAKMLAHCAYEHFGTKRLALRALGAPALDALAIGSIAHRVLARLGRAGFATANVDALLDEEWARVAAGPLGADPAEPFEREMLRAQLHELIEAERILLGTAAATPTYFELAFGMGDDDRGEERDAASIPNGVTLELPPGSAIAHTVLRGSIDRVDVVERDGRRYGVAIDYKSGKGKSHFDDERDLAEFQLSIYCEALPAFGIEPVGAVYLGIDGAERHGVVRSDFAEAFGVAGMKTVKQREPDDFTAFVKERREALREQVAALAAGKIAIRPRRDDCKYCDLRPVCRIGTFGVGTRGSDD